MFKALAMGLRVVAGVGGDETGSEGSGTGSDVSEPRSRSVSESEFGGMAADRCVM